jgi:hypothetical protein
MVDLEKAFDKYANDYLKFDDVENKLSQRADLHAFILLDKLCPDNTDIVDSAEHDEFYLSIDCERLAKIITEEQVLELARCGVRYDDRFESLAMFA